MTFNAILKKIKLIRYIAFSKSEVFVFSSAEDTTKAAISLSLKKNGISLNSVEDEIHLKKIVDDTYNAIYQNGFNSLNSIQEIATDVFRNNMWNLGIVCGLASIWEFKVRLLAERVGVSNYLPNDEKNKKTKNMHSIGYRKLDPVIKDLRKKTQNKLNIDLIKLNDLRGALVHTNLHQLRVLYNNGYKNFTEELKGNVISFKLGSSETRNLSDSIDSKTAEEQDVFSWFLEGTNSKMLHNILNEFEKCIRKIDDLVAFKAHSHHECSGFFELVFCNGERLNQENEDKYLSRETFSRTVPDSSQFLNRIYGYLNL